MTTRATAPRPRLPAAVRLLAVAAAIVAGLGPWRAAREDSMISFPGFAAPAVPAVSPDEAAFFETTIINPDSNLAKAHSATLAEMPDGSLLSAWYAGSAEGAGDVGIWLAHRGREGKWSAPRLAITRERVVADLGRYIVSLGNPVLLVDGRGRLGLLFVSIGAGKWSGSSMNLTWSDDGGRTWGQISKLTLNPFANLSALPRNPPSALVGGGWAVPIYQEFLGLFPEVLWLQPRGGGYAAAVSRIAGGMSVFQPALVPLSAERAVAVMRDGSDARRMSVAWSRDAGRTWTPPESTDLPNPNSGVCAVRLQGGALLCAFNDSQGKGRENLRLALSRDDGRTWLRIATLQEQAGQEFSYPYMITGRDGRVRMVYSARGRQIRYAEFNTAWVDREEMGLEP